MRWLLALCVALLPFMAAAQDDGTRLSRFLEDQLSDGDDRQVSITGFRGALSSEATLERMTISDADGVWLVLENAVLDWTRAAILRGELHVNALTAERLEVIRPPLPAETVAPTAEAQPFSLPELPVRVDIGQIAIAEVVLGESVIGLPATLSIEGSVFLEGGAGRADITLDRIDGPSGQFILDAAYSNADRNLALSLLLEEAPGGLAVELLGLPDRPDIRLAISGEGPVEEFTADITLATEGEDRITGQVISSLGDNDDQLVVADIGGDISPLLLPEYREFFGDDVQLQAQVRQTADGGTDLENLRLTSAALSVEGALSLDPRGLPVSVSLIGQIMPPEGDDVQLPAGGVDAHIASAGLIIGYDRAEGDTYRLGLEVDELVVDDLRVARTSLDLQGVVGITASGVEAATATLTSALNGIAHNDPALAEAIGHALDLSAQMSWIAGAPMILSDLNLSTGDLSATGGASLQAADGQINVGLDVTAQAGNLARFSAASGQPLAGSADLGITGQIEALSAAFDLTFTGTGQDLHIADAIPVELFAGETELAANVVRNGDGLNLSDLSLENAELSLSGAANLSSGDTTATTRFQLQNVGLFTDILSGPVTITADVARIGTEPFDITAALTGPNEIRANVSGQFDAETTGFDLALAASATDLDVGNGVPRQLLAGQTDLSATATRVGDVLTLSDLSLTNPELTLTGEASMGPDTSRADIQARLANVGLFTDALSGPVTADAAITRDGSDPWQIDVDLGGPGGMRAAVDGRVGLSDGSVDLTATGQAPLALANRYIQPRSIQGVLTFDLAVRGQPGLGALSGTLRSNGARIAVPTFGIALENVGLNGNLSGGRLSLDANGVLSSGGNITTQGSINLANAGMDGQISIGVRDARLVDPTLYEARISNADLTVSGPLARRPQINGTVTLGESEIRVPEASPLGAAGIPDIRHTGESTEQRLTRQFAGLLGRASSGGGSNTTGLDITINAPGRIFLRGRGIDAEFGGSLRVFGTTANVIPTGQFDLLRGRLSVLGTRLDFVEGSATLQGSFDPFLRLAATSRASGYQITIRVIGTASSPDITFESDPSLPEDEVLAQLLFGRSVSGLSPLQLLQLADAATSLAGGSTNSGFIAGLRDNLGLDDLDLSTDEQGNAAVTAGRYLSENIYTDITINAEGDADLSLNIDLTPNITARGSVGSGGGSSIGIFFEQDY